MAEVEHVEAFSEKSTVPSFLKSEKRRVSSPALAKDIASRRGIPQTQPKRVQSTAPNVSTLQAVGRMSTGQFTTAGALRERMDKGSMVPGAMAVQSQDARNQPAETATGQDEGFARFYTHLTSGPFSRLSSMLAFTGLPLTEESQEEVATQSARASPGPDVNRLFSRAALRAIEEQQRNQGFPGSAFGPGESFYVIPTSGGTASYADILSKAQQGAQNGGFNEEADEYVDARELPVGQSPRIGSSRHREEELQIENQALKQILDKLSHRLQAFESHAQDASMAALTQSMASVRGPSGTPHPELEERMRAMEGQLEREMKEREKLGLENQKQKQIISKYRSHWEQLKDSARAKDKAKRDKAESAN